MRVLITGGAGFIGSHLADALIKDGHQVAIIDDLSTGRAENFAHLQAMPQFQFAVETIDNETVMDRMVSECDVIYHLAAAVGVELIINRPVEVIERCVLGTDSVLRVATRYRKKVILTSTSEVYGKNTKVPFDEEADRILGPTTRSRWSYSCAKAIDEFLALAFHKERHLPIVITRLFNTVGPRQMGQYGMVVPRFVQRAIAGQAIEIYGTGEQSRCFCNVSDVVGALTALMDCDAIATLPNWQQSRGACLEMWIAIDLDMPIFECRVCEGSVSLEQVSTRDIGALPFSNEAAPGAAVAVPAGGGAQES